MSVVTAPLSSVCETFSGFAWSASKFNQEQRGLPIIRIQNVDGVATNDFVYWDEPYDKRFVIHDGDLLLTLSGSFRVASWNRGEALLNQRIVKLTPSHQLDRQWLFHVLRYRLEEIERLGKHALVNNVSLGDLRKLRIPLPPLAEQRRIAGILDKAEALRAKRRSALAKIDILPQAIFLELFGDPATNPKGWRKAPLAEAVVRPLQNGAYFPADRYCQQDGVEMVHMSDAFYGIISRGTLKRVDCTDAEIEKYAISDSDLLVARRSINYEGAAQPCLVPASDKPLIFESSFIRVTPDPVEVTVLYLFYYLMNTTVRQRFVRPFVTQSTISGINQSNLARVIVIIPPIELQREFARRVEAVEKLKATQRASLAKLDALFASLQHRAFRGEL